MRFLTAIAFTSLGMLVICSQEAKASIGEVILHEGSGVIERKDNGESVESQIEAEVFSYDTIRTAKGKTAIDFESTLFVMDGPPYVAINTLPTTPNTKKIFLFCR